MDTRRICDLLKTPPVGETLTVRGWVRTRRDSKGGFSFVEISDGSSLKNLQAVVPASLPEYESVVLKLATGASVAVTGVLKESPAAGQPVELAATSVEMLGEADNSFPLQKKRHSLEYLRTISHLRARTNTFGAVARVRHTAAQAIHRFMDENGFFYVHTPLITASDAEGAGELFAVTTLDPRTAVKDGKVAWEQDFFGRQAFLTVSGQLEAETYALALGRVYTFGPTFRAENSNTARHLAEFWMIEPEMAFADLDLNAEIAEAFLKSVLTRLLNERQQDLEFFNQHVDDQVLATVEQVAREPFARMTYTEAVKILQATGRAWEYPVAWGTPLQSEHERYLAEEHCKRPVILTDYPADFSAFYMRLSEDGRTVRNMDVLVPRVGEIIGGSQREERYDVQRQRMVDRGLDPVAYDWYLDLRRFGTAPHAGFGLGFERLLMFVTGMKNIRDVIPFPRTPGHAEP